MDEKLQAKVCHLMMIATGALIHFDPELAIALAIELTDDERDLVMSIAEGYEVSDDE